MSLGAASLPFRVNAWQEMREEMTRAKDAQESERLRLEEERIVIEERLKKEAGLAEQAAVQHSGMAQWQWGCAPTLMMLNDGDVHTT